jgi:hypothetical protein
MKALPHKRVPCSNCPFRKDCPPGWLGELRMKEILEFPSFVCHKDNNLQCAGHMIIKGNTNIYVETAKKFNIELDLEKEDLIFKSEQECINHHKNDR